MCGRFVVARPADELVTLLRVDVVADRLPAPSFNVAPTDSAAIVLDSHRTAPPTRRLEPARWGLVPSWAKDAAAGARAFNARAEDLQRRPMFRGALRERRAVVPVTGYYEWKQEDGRKRPHFIHPSDGSPLYLAGLYEWWRDRARADDDPDRWLLSFTILTRDSVGALGSVHDRMPVTVSADAASEWLSGPDDQAADLVQMVLADSQSLAPALEIYPVSPAVGNVRNDNPALIDRVEGAAGS